MMEMQRGEAAVVPAELAAASRLGDEASLGASPPLRHVRGSAAGAAVEPAALAHEPAGPMPPAYPLDFGRRVHRHLSRRGPRGLEPVARKPVSDARDGATQAVADLLEGEPALDQRLEDLHDPNTSSGRRWKGGSA